MRVWIGTDAQMLDTFTLDQIATKNEDWDLMVSLWKGKPQSEIPEDTDGALIVWNTKQVAKGGIGDRGIKGERRRI